MVLISFRVVELNNFDKTLSSKNQIDGKMVNQFRNDKLPVDIRTIWNRTCNKLVKWSKSKNKYLTTYLQKSIG